MYESYRDTTEQLLEDYKTLEKHAPNAPQTRPKNCFRMGDSSINP